MSKKTLRNTVGRTWPSAITIVVVGLAVTLVLIAAGGRGF